MNTFSLNLNPSQKDLKFGPLPVSFPLTPTLSLRERENRRPAIRPHDAFGFAESLESVRPLPWGEGWGEGEARPVTFLVRENLREEFMRFSKSESKGEPANAPRLYFSKWLA